MICTLNPHIGAIRETLSTMKFAQRAKMIKNKAVVNEENSDAEYWKQKYLALLRQSDPASQGAHNARAGRKSGGQAAEEDSHMRQDLPPVHGNGENLTPSWNSTLTTQLKEQAA